MGSHPLNSLLHLHPIYLQREEFSKSPQTLNISFHLGHLQEDGVEKSYGEYHFFFALCSTSDFPSFTVLGQSRCFSKKHCLLSI